MDGSFKNEADWYSYSGQDNELKKKIALEKNIMGTFISTGSNFVFFC